MVFKLPGCSNCAIAARTPLPNDYIAFWNPSLITGSTLPDATGNHDATLNGNAQKDGYWLLLDGNGDYAIAADSADWNTATITLYAEIKAGTQASPFGAIMSRDKTVDPNDRVFYLALNADGRIRMQIYNASEVAQIVYSTNTFDDSASHNVAASVDGSRIKIIVDGVVEADESQTVTLDSASAEGVSMGMRDRESGGTPAYYDGRLGKMGFWDYAINEDILKGATR